MRCFHCHSRVQRARLLKDLPPDWDFIAWGYEFKTFLWVELLPGISVAEIRPNFHLLHQNIAEFSKLDTPRVLMKLRHQFGTLCYSVSPAGARRLIDFCLPLKPGFLKFTDFPITIENIGIDCAMNGAFPTMNAYACIPPLVVPVITECNRPLDDQHLECPMLICQRRS